MKPTTRNVIFLASLLNLAAAAAPAAGDQVRQDKQAELAISAGRLHAMLGKTEVLLGLDEDETAPTGDTVEETDDPFVLLKDAVIRYDRDLSDACQRQAIAGAQCNDLLAPWWLAAHTAPGRVDVGKLIEGVTPHIAALWKTACQSRGKGSDPSLCEIE